MAKMIDGEKLIKKLERMKKIALEGEASENFDRVNMLISISSICAWDWVIKEIREEMDDKSDLIPFDDDDVADGIGQAFSPD